MDMNTPSKPMRLASQLVIVAFCVFMLVKVINRIRRKEQVAPTVPPAPTREESLLGEIRDILKARSAER